jgi:SNF family Na+-dependent transporter
MKTVRLETLAFRRLHPKAEVLGWWQLAICCVIAVYYAAILAPAESSATRYGIMKAPPPLS